MSESQARRGRLVRVWIALAAAALIAAAVWFYVDSGRIDDGAVPAAQVSAGNYESLGRYLQGTPKDARAWAIYARMSVERADFTAAVAAYARALELPGRVAQDPLVWCEYADALAMTGGGKLAGKPRELIDRALTLNPRHPRALEMAGSAEIERGDYAAALRYWEPLLQILPPESAEYREILSAIERVRGRAPF